MRGGVGGGGGGGGSASPADPAADDLSSTSLLSAAMHDVAEGARGGRLCHVVLTPTCGGGGGGGGGEEDASHQVIERVYAFSPPFLKPSRDQSLGVQELLQLQEISKTLCRGPHSMIFQAAFSFEMPTLSYTWAMASSITTVKTRPRRLLNRTRVSRVQGSGRKTQISDLKEYLSLEHTSGDM